VPKAHSTRLGERFGANTPVSTGARDCCARGVDMGTSISSAAGQEVNETLRGTP
jgi:hypothetical protein